MNMAGEQRIAASLQRVWEALNDPEILRASIPGCQSLAKESDVRFTATVEVKVGPIGARFKGAVSLQDLNPPNGYTLILDGNGGIAGSVKGIAKVQLKEEGGGTLLAYTVEAQVGGRMAQLGGPIIDATAKQLAGKFFSTFGKVLGGDILSGVKPAEPVGAKAVVPTDTSALPVGAPAYRSPSDSRWAGVAIGLLLILVAAASFEYGRRTAAPVLVIDNAVLQRLIDEARQFDETQLIDGAKQK